MSPPTVPDTWSAEWKPLSRHMTRVAGRKRLELHGILVASSPHTLRTCSSPQGEAHTGRPTATDTIGLDLHGRESQLCVGHDDATVEERPIVTSRERFAALLGDRPPPRRRLARICPSA